MKKRISATTAGFVCVVLLLCARAGAADSQVSAKPKQAKPPAAVSPQPKENKSPTTVSPSSKEQKAPTGVHRPSKERKPSTRRVTPASFTPEMRFEDAIDILRNCTNPPLNIVVFWKEIGDNADIHRDTPIGLDGVRGIRVGACLNLLLASVSAGASAKIGYTINEGVIVVATPNALPVKKVVRVYDVSDLVAPPAQYFLPMMGFGGMGRGGFGGAPMMGNYGGGLGAGSGRGSSYLPPGSYGRARRGPATYRRR